jgi:hypothetical protein
MDMPTPLLDFLEGRAKSALPFLRAGVKQGQSATQIIANLAPLNLTFRRQAMLDVIAALQGKITPERKGGIEPPLTRLLGVNTPIPQDLHNPAVVNLNSNYQYVVNFAQEGVVTSDYLTVSSAVPLSIANIKLLGSLIANTGYLADVEAPQVSPTDVGVIEANVSPTAP